jgi:hypothetical protein
MNYRYRKSRRIFEYAKDEEHIKIPGYRGTWYVLDQLLMMSTDGSGKKKVFSLLESEQDGDDSLWLLVDETGKVLNEGQASLFELLIDAYEENPSICKF